LRFIENRMAFPGSNAQWLQTKSRSLSVHSYGVVTESHRLPEHQMLGKISRGKFLGQSDRSSPRDR
jgi:hypothetical protein